MKYSGQLCQNLKGAAFYCSGRWASATARYEVSITNATSSWEQRESYCVLGRAGLLGVVTAKAGCWMRELVVWHVSLSPSKRSVRPMPVICRFISGFVYLMYNAYITSNRLKSFSCLIILVLLTICYINMTNLLYINMKKFMWCFELIIIANLFSSSCRRLLNFLTKYRTLKTLFPEQ